MSVVKRLALAIGLTIFNPLSVSAAERLAFLVGNSVYKTIENLKNPVRDIKLIEHSLKEAKYDVFKVENAGNKDFNDKLKEFTAKIRLISERNQKIESILFYYAGHAIQSQGRNYILPVDVSLADGQLKYAVPLNQIVADLNSIRSGNYIFILDACRDDPFPSNQKKYKPGLAEIDAGLNNFISFSARPGAQALDGDGDNSPFALFLSIEMIKQNIPIEVVFRQVRKSVYEKTDGFQLPWDASSLVSDFRFIPLGPYGHREDVVSIESQQDDQWNEVRKQNYSIDSLRKYLFLFPRGKHATVAEKMLKGE